MNYSAIFGTGLLMLGVHAADAASPTSPSRRQLSGCMTKQMTASRTISYNEASKVCKDQLKSQNDALVEAPNDNLAANEAKPANAR